MSSHYWAVDEDWTHDLFLTKEVLYPWATTASHSEEWCKSRKQISFDQIFTHIFMLRAHNAIVSKQRYKAVTLVTLYWYNDYNNLPYSNTYGSR